MSELAPYAELVALAERERTLIDAEAWADLAALAERRIAVVATLPAIPPPSAGPLIARLAAELDLTCAALRTACSGVAGELASLAQGRTAIRSYATVAAQT